MSLSSQLHSLLSPVLEGEVCILGMGNRLKGDDGAGPLLVEQVSGKTNADLVDAGLAPENHLEKVARLEPDTVVIVDAVSFGGRPGEVRLLEPEQLGSGAVSTHAVPLATLCDYLQTRTGAGIVVVGIQPRNVKLADTMSREVMDTVDALAVALTTLLPRH